MSSHHIIREDQEPALLILDAKAIEFAQVQELLEWSPTVMVSDQVLKEVLSWGIKIDIVIAKEENISNLTTSLVDQSPVKLLSHSNKVEALSTALDFLISSKQKAVNVMGMIPLENFESFSSLDISVFQGEKRWSFIRSGHYEKWFPAGRTVYVFPSNGQTEIKTNRDGVVVIDREKGFWVSEF
jgi:thiamine pyrophosphokinase